MRNEAAGPPPTLDAETLAFAQRVFQHARAGRARELEELLDAGLPPNLRNDKGDTLLMLACYHGHRDAARLLLARGADPEIANDRGQTPLAAAAYQGDLGMVILLLELGAGAHLDARDADGLTAEAAARIMGAAATAAQLALAGSAAERLR